jgi:hypothetical protein
MIFDFLSVQEFEKKTGTVSIDDAFLKHDMPQGSARGYSSKIVSRENFRCVFRSRDEQIESYADGQEWSLFIVGETFLSTRGEQVDAKLSGKLSAHSVLGLMKSQGEGFIDCLKGNYQLILIDYASNTCTIWNSRHGISPFYYASLPSAFFCSTNLAALVLAANLGRAFDGAAIVEHALFNYPLLDRTPFTGVKSLGAGEKICIGPAGLKVISYFDLGSLFRNSQFEDSEALERGAVLFRKVVNTIAADQEKIALSLTGGFDGRATLAALERPKDRILCYAFGIPGSVNLRIPETLCRTQGFRFQPIELDAEYENVFDRYADRAVIDSDGLSTAERANYPYAFEKLASWSPVVMTGIFGSELMRTFQNVGFMVSEAFVELNGVSPSRCPDVLRRAAKRQRYLKEEFVVAHLEEVISDVGKLFSQCESLQDSNERFYYFLLTHGLRKYFGAEVHMERWYATNRFPYLDDDFVSFIFKSPFAGVRSNALKPTVLQRFRSQFFYAYVMKKFKPELLRTPTDHGFPPADLLKPFPMLWIGPKFLYHRQIRKWRRYREFKTEEWTGAYYQKNIDTLLKPSDIFSAQLGKDFENNSWLQKRAEFAKAASLKLWLDKTIDREREL